MVEYAKSRSLTPLPSCFFAKTTYTPQGDGNKNGRRGSARPRKNNLHPARGRKPRVRRRRYGTAKNNLHPARGRKLSAKRSLFEYAYKTTYTPQGDGNFRLCHFSFHPSAPKQLTPRKGTETYSYLILKLSLVKTTYTPQGDGNTEFVVMPILVDGKTTYTPQGDGNGAYGVRRFPIIENNLHPARGRKLIPVVVLIAVDPQCILHPARGRKLRYDTQCG